MNNVATSDEFEAMFGATPAPSSPDQDRIYCIAKLQELRTKSAVIRYLTAEGWKRGRIAKGMDILYQHVRNEQLRQAKKTEAK
jgi:hypothetical protein